MSKTVAAFKTLYSTDMITLEAVKAAVKGKVITEEEYTIITGLEYEEE